MFIAQFASNGNWYGEGVEVRSSNDTSRIVIIARTAALALGDVPVEDTVFRDRESCARRERDVRRHDENFERLNIVEVDYGPVHLHDIVVRTRHTAHIVIIVPHLLDTPVEVLLEVRLDGVRVKRAQARVRRDRLIQVHKALDDELRLPAAVRAALRGAVHKRMVRSGVVWAHAPLGRILRHLPKEEEDAEAAAERVLLEPDAGRPFPVATRRCAFAAGDGDRNVGLVVRLAGGLGGALRHRSLWCAGGQVHDGREYGSATAGRPVQLVDYLCDASSNGVLVAEIKTVELGVGVPQLTRRHSDRVSRRPEGALSVPEWGQR